MVKKRKFGCVFPKNKNIYILDLDFNKITTLNYCYKNLISIRKDIKSKILYFSDDNLQHSSQQKRF